MLASSPQLKSYLSAQQLALLSDGEFLVADCDSHPELKPSDYSYLVFPFAKMYEGFLKQLFLDLEIIGKREYNSDHFRIGKTLSPNLVHKLHNSAFRQVSERYGHELALQLWQTWKEGRNLVFHYFPHNLRSLNREEAIRLINQIIETMESAVIKTHVKQSFASRSQDNYLS